MTSLSAGDPTGRVARRLVLASASPRRAAILKAAGYTFEVATSGVDERVEPESDPSETAKRVANDKATAVYRGAAESVVIGADTVVIVDGELLGKPASPADGPPDAVEAARTAASCYYRSVCRVGERR